MYHQKKSIEEEKIKKEIEKNKEYNKISGKEETFWKRRGGQNWCGLNAQPYEEISQKEFLKWE